MIGQEHIRLMIDNTNQLPRFIILSGNKGMGKLELCKYISKRFNKQLIVVDNKIDDIRNVIEISNEIASDILIVIREANNMSISAANSLLKIAEEAPNNVHLVMCVENHSLVLPTLISRGRLFILQDYSNGEKQQYSNDNNLSIDSTYFTYYETLEQLKKVSQEEIEELVTLCEKIIIHIDTTNGANAFNILKSIAIKDGDLGFEINHFLYALETRCLMHIHKNRAITEINSRILESIRTARNKLRGNFKVDFIMDKLILDMKGV